MCHVVKVVKRLSLPRILCSPWKVSFTQPDRRPLGAQSTLDVLLRLQQASAAALHAESGEVGTIRLGFIPTASFHILPRVLAKIRNTLPPVNVELKEGPEDPQVTGLRSGAFDICIGHLSRTYDQIENMLLIRERLVVALPKGHSVSRKRYVGLRDLEGELLIMPS
jgi:DNA-binding transcriptional LysR family regulator